MIYLTGDTHIPIDISKLNTTKFPEQKKLSREDYVIVLGDFGLLWSDEYDKSYQHWLKWLKQKPFTLLWLDGNHENFDWINDHRALPVETWHGGKVQFVADNIIHLMRGQIYELEGKSFFVLGGASSIDKKYRKEHLSWWKEEEPSQEELDEAFANLERQDNHVDYIMTHTCPAHIVRSMFHTDIHTPPHRIRTELALDEIDQRVTCSRWFFGHWHMDTSYQKYQCLYQNVFPLSLTF